MGKVCVPSIIYNISKWANLGQGQNMGIWSMLTPLLHAKKSKKFIWAVPKKNIGQINIKQTDGGYFIGSALWRYNQ